MSKTAIGLSIFALFAAVMVALIGAGTWRVPFRQALARCIGWALFVLACLFFNYMIADALGLSKQSSGYARGRSVISSYGFLVQTLLFVEVGLAWYALRAMKRRGK